MGRPSGVGKRGGREWGREWLGCKLTQMSEREASSQLNSAQETRSREGRHIWEPMEVDCVKLLGTF